MTDRHASLLARIAELRAQASPGPLGVKLRDFDALLYDRDTDVIAQFRDGSMKHKANAALAAPAHEMAACVEALVELGEQCWGGDDGEWEGNGWVSPELTFEAIRCARAPLDALAKALGVP